MVTEMDRILDIWDEELSSIVEIEKIGHRRRILLSVAGPAALHKRGEKKRIEKKVVAAPVPKCEAHRRKSPTEETGTATQDVKRHSASGSELGVVASSNERRYTSTSSASEGSSKPPTPSRTRKNMSEAGAGGAGTLTLGRRKKKAPLPPAGTTTGQPAKEDPIAPVVQVSPQSRQRASAASKTPQKPIKIQTEVKKCSKHAASNVSPKLQPELPEVIDIPPPLAFSCSFQVQRSIVVTFIDLYPR